MALLRCWLGGLLVLSSCAGGEAYVQAGLSGCLGAQRRAGALRRARPLASSMIDEHVRDGAAAPPAPEALSRRAAVLAGAAVLAPWVAPRAGYAYDFKKVSSGDALFDVPAVWKKTAEDAEAGTFAFADPVSGKVLDQITVREYEAPAGVTSTKDAGKIEKVVPSKVFGATKQVCLCAQALTPPACQRLRR
jgi:hypothetical protein